MKCARRAGRAFAGLLGMAAFLSAPSALGQALQPGGPVDFGSLGVGAAPRTYTLTFSASVPTVIKSVDATTNGVTKEDFTIVFQTCTGTQTPPQSCTITLGFSPTAPGLRKGALSITDSTGTVVNRVFLHGIGIGPQIVVTPAIGAVLSSLAPITPSGYAPSGVALDGGGDLYFNDAQFDRILEQIPAGTLSVTDLLFSSQNSAVAIDGAGTLYIAAGGLVYSLVPGSVAVPVATGSTTLTNATGLAVDGSGYLYIADSGQNRIVRVGPDGTVAVLAFTGLSTPLAQPAGLAIDANNLLYIADAGNNRVVVSGLYTGVSTVLPLGSLNLSSPQGVVTDAGGSVAIADTGNKRLVIVPPSGGSFVLSTPGVTFSDPVNLALKDNGDLVVGDPRVGVVTLVRSAASLTFPTPTGVGHLDVADGALPFTVLNSGNVPLQLTIPASGINNPAISTIAFATTSASTCPLVTSASTADASTQLIVGEACNYTVSFTPQTLGLNTAVATLTAAPLGGGTTITPNVQLNGTGIPNIVSFGLVATPSVTQPGVAVSLTVSALDANGVVDPTYRGTATFTATDPLAKFFGGTSYTFTAADNGTHTFSAPASGVQFNTLGTYTISAKDGAVTGTSNNVLVVQANGFTLTASPSTIPLNGTVALTITATFNGALATGYTGTVSFSATDPTASFLSGTTYTFKASDNGTHTFPAPAGVQFNSVGTFTISATDGLFTGTSNQVQVVAANGFTIQLSPSPIFSGQSAGYTITATYNGVAATNFTGTVILTSSDSTSQYLTGTSTVTFNASDKGVVTEPASLGVTFAIPGLQHVTATDGGITGTSNNVLVIGADSFTITAAPTPIFAGQSVGYTVSATSGGTPVTYFTGTVTFTTTDTSAKFATTGTNSFTYTFTPADNGTHTFTVPNGVQFNTGGTYTIGATSTPVYGTVTGISNPIVVNATDGFSITAAPTPILVGQSVGYTVTATHQGSTVTNFTGTVTFTTTDSTAKFVTTGTNSFTYTFTPADNGTHTFTLPSLQFNAPGTFTVNASFGAVASVSNPIVVVAADAFTITASPTPILAGQSVGYTVTAMYKGAVVTNFMGTVTFTTTDPSAVIKTSSYTFTAGDNGTHTFTPANGIQYNTPGTYTITVADGGITGVSNQIVVIGADGFSIVAAPANLLLGQSAGYTVTAMYKGAVATGFFGTVNFTTTDPAGVFLSGTSYTFTAADNGTHTFPVAGGVQFNTLGTFTISATYGVLSGTSNNIIVTNPSATVLTSSANPSLLGQPITLTATVTGANFTPGGTVVFMDGGAGVTLGSAMVQGGVAMLNNVILPNVGSHTLLAVYSGDAHFNPSTSAPFYQVIEDFTVMIYPGTPTTGYALVGHTATYSLLVSPLGGPNFAAPVTLSFTSPLTGAKVVFTPAGIAAGASETTVSVAITPTQLLGMMREGESPQSKRAPVVFFALLLLPLAFVRRKRMAKLLVLAVALLPLTMMTGCLSSATDGYYGSAPQTFTVTLTGTSGTLVRSTEVTITVQ